MIFIGAILVAIYFWDQIAFKVNQSTGESAGSGGLPFIYQASTPVIGKATKYASEAMVLAVGFVLIIIGLLRR